MTVHDEMIVGRLLVLADSRLDERCVLHRRKAQAKVLANSAQPIRVDHSFAVCGIERGPSCVVGNFEAAALVSGNAVAKTVAMLSPYGKMTVVEALSRGHTKEEDILLGGTNAVPDRLRKQFAQPWSAGEHVLIRRDCRPIGQR